MPSILELRRQIDALDKQIVELLSRRNVLARQIAAQTEDDGPDKAREEQVLSNWLEEGFDYELDEAPLEKVCRAVIELGRKAKDH